MSFNNVLIGRNSRLWQVASRNTGVAKSFRAAISHAELDAFQFLPDDRVWVFAYSRVEADNEALLEQLRQTGVREVVYLGSSSAIVNDVTSCYEYPRVKSRAERAAQRLVNARVVILGQVYQSLTELPAGRSLATSQQELEQFLIEPRFPQEPVRRQVLAEMLERPFGSPMERWAYRSYGILQALSGRWPCVLRPVDLLLRAVGFRWYGYVYLSNRLWSTTSW